MTTRILSQSLSLFLSILTVVLAVMGMRLRPSYRPTLTAALLYGLSEFTFYLIVLVWRNFSLANTLSPLRAFLENILVFTVLLIFVTEWLKANGLRRDR